MTHEPSNEPMSDAPPVSEIEDFLKDLQSADTTVRRHRIQALREQNIADERIVEALKMLAAGDPAGSVRKDAKKTLKSTGIEAPPLTPELAKKRRDFWMGVGLYFGLNFVMWAGQFGLYIVLSSISLDYDLTSTITTIAGFLPYLINIGLIIFLAFKRPQMALGMLAGFGILLLIVVCLFLITLAVCFISLGSYQ